MPKMRQPRCRRQLTTKPESAAAVDTSDDKGGPGTGPLRRCIVTRERLPKERMIRFVIGPDRQIVPDLTARLPGRGMWLSASRDVLESSGAQEEKRLEGGRQHKQGDAVNRN